MQTIPVPQDDWQKFLNLLEASIQRLEAGHNETCGIIVSAYYGCSCGHDDVNDAVKELEAIGF